MDEKRPCEGKEPTHSIVMKVDPPENNSSEKDEENCEHDSGKPYSPGTRGFPPSRPGNPILSSPRLGSSFGANPFALKSSAFGASKSASASTGASGLMSSSPKPVLLRPSQLAVGSTESQQATAKKPVPLNSMVLRNPFARVTSSPEKPGPVEASQPVGSELRPSGDVPVSFLAGRSMDVAESVKANQDPSPVTATTPKFVPLGTPATQRDDSSSSGAASTSNPAAVTGFVFGQNLHERVAEAVTLESADSSNSKPVEAVGTSNNVPSSAQATTNGTSEMLFTSVIRKDHNNDSSGSETSERERPSKSLSEAAREYEEARAVKRKYEEVAVVTGEEDEANVLQMNCKLFAFDKATGTWVERGRGTLRLNDMDGPGGMQSRVVIRTTGSLRVVLNTKIWAGMAVDRPSPKSVRLTAMDNSGQIKVFLVMASPKETEQLHKSLECRVTSQKERSGEGSSAGAVGGDLAARTLPPEPVLKKRSSLVQDTGGGDGPKM